MYSLQSVYSIGQAAGAAQVMRAVQVDGVAVGMLEGGGEGEELVLHDRATAPDKERRAASRYKVCDMYVCVTCMCE